MAEVATRIFATPISEFAVVTEDLFELACRYSGQIIAGLEADA